MTVPTTDTSPGFNLLTPSFIPIVPRTMGSRFALGLGQQGALLLEATIMWFGFYPPTTSPLSLQVQEYKGEPVLPYWTG